MNKVVNVRVILPDLDISEEEQKEYLDKVSSDISKQILEMINAEKQRETIQYWQAKLLQWQIEDYNNEIKFNKAL